MTIKEYRQKLNETIPPMNISSLYAAMEKCAAVLREDPEFSEFLKTEKIRLENGYSGWEEIARTTYHFKFIISDDSPFAALKASGALRYIVAPFQIKISRKKHDGNKLTINTIGIILDQPGNENASLVECIRNQYMKLVQKCLAYDIQEIQKGIDMFSRMEELGLTTIDILQMADAVNKARKTCSATYFETDEMSKGAIVRRSHAVLDEDLPEMLYWKSLEIEDMAKAANIQTNGVVFQAKRVAKQAKDRQEKQLVVYVANQERFDWQVNRDQSLLSSDWTSLKMLENVQCDYRDILVRSWGVSMRNSAMILNRQPLNEIPDRPGRWRSIDIKTGKPCFGTYKHPEEIKDIWVLECTLVSPDPEA